MKVNPAFELSEDYYSIVKSAVSLQDGYVDFEGYSVSRQQIAQQMNVDVSNVYFAMNYNAAIFMLIKAMVEPQDIIYSQIELQEQLNRLCKVQSECQQVDTKCSVLLRYPDPFETRTISDLGQYEQNPLIVDSSLGVFDEQKQMELLGLPFSYVNIMCLKQMVPDHNLDLAVIVIHDPLNRYSIVKQGLSNICQVVGHPNTVQMAKYVEIQQQANKEYQQHRSGGKVQQAVQAIQCVLNNDKRVELVGNDNECMVVFRCNDNGLKSKFESLGLIKQSDMFLVQYFVDPEVIIECLKQ